MFNKVSNEIDSASFASVTSSFKPVRFKLR